MLPDTDVPPPQRPQAGVHSTHAKPCRRGFMIPGGVPFRGGTLLDSLPIHPSTASVCYQHLCALIPHPTLPASRVRYGKRYEAWLLSRKWPQVRNTLLGYTTLELPVALGKPGLSTGRLL